MDFKLTYCQICAENKNYDDYMVSMYSGCKPGWSTQNVDKCKQCGNSNLIYMGMSEEEAYYASGFNCDFQHIQSMLELKRKNIVEYVIRYQEILHPGINDCDTEDESRNIPKCPTCNSTNIEKISTASKVAGAVAVGILSSNVRNTFKCKNCGYKW